MTKLHSCGLRTLFLVFLVLSACLSLAVSSQGFDIVIVNGHIIDGTGSPWYSGDIGIRGGKIAAIGNLSAAARKQTIDAQGKVVAPGFIDMLGQSELTILVEPRMPSWESTLPVMSGQRRCGAWYWVTMTSSRRPNNCSR